MAGFPFGGVVGALQALGGLRGLFGGGRRRTGIPPYLQDLLRAEARRALSFRGEDYVRNILPTISAFLQPELLRAIGGVTATYGGGIPGIGTALPDTAFGSALRGAMADVAARGQEALLPILANLPLLESQVRLAPLSGGQYFQYLPPDITGSIRLLQSGVESLRRAGVIR